MDDSKNSRKGLSPFVVAIPAIILIAMLKLWPALFSIIASFYEYSFVPGAIERTYVGLENYNSLFAFENFSNLARNTFVLTLLPAVFTSAISLVLSVIISKLRSSPLLCVNSFG